MAIDLASLKRAGPANKSAGLFEAPVQLWYRLEWTARKHQTVRVDMITWLGSAAQGAVTSAAKICAQFHCPVKL